MWSNGKPVEDVLNNGVLSVQAVVLRAGAAPALDRVFDHAVASLPAGAISRHGDEVPNRRAGRRKVGLDHPDCVGALDHAPPGLIFARPRLLEVADPALRFADMLDGLGMFDETLRLRIDPDGPHAGVGIERVGVRLDWLPLWRTKTTSSDIGSSSWASAILRASKTPDSPASDNGTGLSSI